MSKEVKVILIGCGSLALIAVIGVAVAFAFFVTNLSHQIGGGDAASKAKTAAKIASFTLPRGYHYVTAVDLGMMNMVMISPATKPRGFIIQLQGISVPSASETDDQFMQSMQAGMGGKMSCSNSQHVADDNVKTASGKTIALRTLDCENAAVGKMLIEFGRIPSSYPLAFIMASGRANDFDRDALHALVRSMR